MVMERAASKSRLTVFDAARTLLVALPAVAIAALLYLMYKQLSAIPMSGNHIDEYYYAACAVRGLHSGAIPVPSCHDNKGPLTYLLYEILFSFAGDYNFLAVKLTAYGLLVLDAAILAWTAFRIGGFAAVPVTVALLCSCLSSDISNLSLRTETVGGPFLVLALFALCAAPESFRRYSCLVWSGLAVGFALLAKQTYAFAGFAILSWIFLCEPVRTLGGLARFFGRSAAFGSAVLIPFLVFCLLFWNQGNLADFLASFLLYPTVYGGDTGNIIAVSIRHGMTLLSHLTEQPMLVIGTFAACMTLLLFRGSAVFLKRVSDPRYLMMLVLLFLLSVLAALPHFFRSHILLAVWPMALLAGVIFADCWPVLLRQAPRIALVFLCTFLFGLTISLAGTWQTNGREELSRIPDRHLPAVKAGRNTQYAYTLGTQVADFYAQGGFRPASSVQFAWALPGAPEQWSYTKPALGTLRRQWFDLQQARSLTQLYRDFAQTPPSYILLNTDYVRKSGSKKITDIPGFDEYLTRRCRPIGAAESEASANKVLYACGMR